MTGNLFAVSSVVNARFGSAAAAMHTFALAVIGAHLMAGRATGSTARLVRFAGITVAIVAAFAVGSRIVLSATLPAPEGAASTFDRLRVSGAWGKLAPIEPLAAATTVPAPAPVAGQRLAEIRQRRVLRVCVSPDGLPWCFRNGRGEIVGFDIGLAHILAVELRTKLTAVPVPRTGRGAMLANGTCDVVTNRIVPSETTMSFTDPLAYEAWAFLTRDHRRGDFATLERIRELEKPRIAVLRIQEWLDRLQAVLPRAEIPKFGAVVPSPGLDSVPIAIAVPRGEHDLLEFLNAVIEDSLANGLFADRLNYWIKGGGARAEREPRWSIGGNVLGLWKD